MKKLITLTSDFGVQTQGIGQMEAVAFEINPEAKIVHLMHGLPDFNLFYAARTLETLYHIPIGYHVCVVDPSVGTKRKAIIIETGRGDFLIGPDNGVLIPATRFLGGIKKVIEITNEKYMKKPVSPIFHGRDIFTPAAAWLSKGIPIENFGPELDPKDLTKAPYEEAFVEGNEIKAKIISINKFGSFHLNITPDEWDKLGIQKGKEVLISFNNNKIIAPYLETFGEAGKGKPLIMKDDYRRIEVALNQDSLVKKYPAKIGDDIIIKKNEQ